MTLPFPRPLPVLSRALSVAASPVASITPPRGMRVSRTLADLASALDTAQRALRDLEEAARCVHGAIAAGLFSLAGDAATEIETAGYDLFLAVGEAGP
ncbi:hypothetical protein ACE7GA_27000 (plasmid) [Roseomonas sp. CCTCC AB2023176]|uniref:hypothetical protein n=1 Tax=Roseomonas sp. CCTCC AB2023176 TaxID=3342640 RepID=UPI0035DD5811